ncbi:unnamed protein product [Linum trigynum]|uniref:Uncharacterized protein n=1 Tax=Linum trigynum TaxID=586398 RepID=A0AAV2DTA8_9ROSI
MTNSEKPSRDELINRMMTSLDIAMAACRRAIMAYDRVRTPPPPQVDIMTAMEEAEIAIPPVATALPLPQAAVLAESKYEEEKADVGDVAPPAPLMSLVPLAAPPTSVSKIPPPSQEESLVSMKMDPFLIAPTLAPPTSIASPTNPLVCTQEPPSLDIELEPPLASAAKAAPALARLAVKYQREGKPQSLWVNSRPLQIQRTQIPQNSLVTYFRCAYTNSRLASSTSEQYGVDRDFLYWWKRRKKGRDIANTPKMGDNNILRQGRLEPSVRKEAMACAFDLCYLDKDFDNKTYKRKRRLGTNVVIRRMVQFRERMNEQQRVERAEGGDGWAGSAIWVDLWARPIDCYGSRMNTYQEQPPPELIDLRIYLLNNDPLLDAFVFLCYTEVSVDQEWNRLLKGRISSMTLLAGWPPLSMIASLSSTLRTRPFFRGLVMMSP